MNNISDKNVIIVIIVTIIFVFALIFTVKSPERKIIESPIIWKNEFSNLSVDENDLRIFKNYFYV